MDLTLVASVHLDPATPALLIIALVALSPIAFVAWRDRSRAGKPPRVEDFA